MLLFSDSSGSTSTLTTFFVQIFSFSSVDYWEEMHDKSNDELKEMKGRTEKKSFQRKKKQTNMGIMMK